jgi:hypothetical protein
VFPGGRVTAVRPADPDLKGDYSCKLLRGADSIFVVETDCQVTAGRIKNGREYELVIAVNDGRHDDVQVAMTLNFVQFSPYALEQSVAVRLHKTSAEKVLGFFRSTNDGDGRLLDLLSLAKLDSVEEGETETFDCLLALKEHDLVLPRAEALSYVRQRFESTGSELFDVSVDYNPCNEAPCKNFGSCSADTSLLNVTDVAEFDNTVFNSPKFEQRVRCQCSAQFTGEYMQYIVWMLHCLIRSGFRLLLRNSKESLRSQPLLVRRPVRPGCRWRQRF